MHFQNILSTKYLAVALIIVSPIQIVFIRNSVNAST